jgi:hypothetical protein
MLQPRALVAAISLMAIAALASWMPTAKGHTHRDSQGSITWYPRECCHEGDCRPVAEITPGDHGMWIKTVDGYTAFVHSSQERRPSADTRWHICITLEDNDTPRIRCLFEPAHS